MGDETFAIFFVIVQYMFLSKDTLLILAMKVREKLWRSQSLGYK